ncbi:DUF1365 domain-containing protein [Kiloniella majae]|uniref:DUF1365 domain-containing protein n=1 Tax=Kiloniella majae TaxID=1938558 RepID=UPI000A27862D|nr:DUF1365 domain-containing protein [Kiloniella majae]
MGIAPKLLPKLLNAKVFHKRFSPKVNSFTYGIYYYCLPLSQLSPTSTNLEFPINKKGLVSFYEKDHGKKDGSCLSAWARELLERFGVTQADGEIMLVAMPRILGYVFNPVSFWLCLDQDEKLRAVICEVNNTFGETHCYLCKHEDGHPIEANEKLQTQKLFHVSPFIEREGHYEFRFNFKVNHFAVCIDLFNASGEKTLATSLCGKLSPLTKAAVTKAFWQHPLVTFKAIYLIHWQAIKLIVKGIKHLTKPDQKSKKVSVTSNLTKSSSNLTKS